MVDKIEKYIIKRAEYANCVGMRERAKILQELRAQARLVNVCAPHYLILHTDENGVIDGIESDSGRYEWNDDKISFVKVKGGE